LPSLRSGFLPCLSALACLAAAPGLPGQSWDPGARAAALLGSASGGKLKLNIEWRVRYESRTGNSFGAAPDIATGLMRTRVSLTWLPAPWLKVSGAMQDSRAPGYGPNAPNTARDSADLFEACVEAGRDRGPGLAIGRQALSYGESRLLGTSQWSNVPRAYDLARAWYRIPKARIEALLASPVTVRIDGFNRPVLGQRVWGTYDSFPDFVGKHLLEAYALRHDQNRPGGFTGGDRAHGTDKLGVNTFGFRLAGPLANAAKYSLEAAAQNGRVGPATHRAVAWFASATRHWAPIGKPLDVSVEYKYASGTRDPADTSRSATFDPLFPSNHDKFGHEDLFGWRNIHNLRSLANLRVAKNLALNLMYDDFWLASARDALYSSSGKSIARSATGAAGRHVGREADLFATYKWQSLTFGAGYGYLFAGDFLRRATQGVAPSYLYVFQTYTR
jgi:hypothetical protein